jgi:hypothetical protein
MFHSRAKLKQEIEGFYHLLIGYFGYSIKILKLRRSTSWIDRSMPEILINTSAGPKQPTTASIKHTLERHRQQINEAKERIENEAKAAKYKYDISVPSQIREVNDVRSEAAPFNIPPNRKFCGREELLKTMETMLLQPDDRPKTGVSILLHGLGSMGKSSLAVKYIHEHMDLYSRQIFWLYAETHQKLMTSVASIYSEQSPVSETSGTDLIKAKSNWKNWLSGTGKLMLQTIHTYGADN